jgi:Asp/Glu/hydantoin racemase
MTARASSASPARIWYQSFVHPVEQAPYTERLQHSLDDLAGAEMQFEVHGLEPPDHFFTRSPNSAVLCRRSEMPLEAQRLGYDAFVIGHFQEPGLCEIRGALDIPVIGLGEASLLAALSMGHWLGLVTIDPLFISWHERLGALLPFAKCWRKRNNSCNGKNIS